MIDKGDLINEMYVIQNDVERLIKRFKSTNGCGHDRYNFEVAIEHLNQINSEIEDAIFVLDFPDPDAECTCDKEISDEEEEKISKEYDEYFEQQKIEIRKIRSLNEGGV